MSLINMHPFGKFVIGLLVVISAIFLASRPGRETEIRFESAVAPVSNAETADSSLPANPAKQAEAKSAGAAALPVLGPVAPLAAKARPATLASRLMPPPRPAILTNHSWALPPKAVVVPLTRDEMTIAAEEIAAFEKQCRAATNQVTNRFLKL